MTKTINFKGASFVIPDDIESARKGIGTGGYASIEQSFKQEQEVRDRWWDIQPGDIVLDIGAHFGSYTIPALALGAEYVFSWSPEDNNNVIEWLLDLNPGFKERCMVITEFGLYSHEGKFSVPHGWFHHDEISVTTLDNFIFNILDLRPPRIDWVKIDTEGAELEILKGSVDTVAEYRPKQIMVENHISFDKEMEVKIERFMKDTIYHDMGILYAGQTEFYPLYGVSHTLWTLQQ